MRKRNNNIENIVGLKRILVILLIIPFTAYLLGIIGDPFLFVILFPIATYSVISILLFFFIRFFIWKFLPFTITVPLGWNLLGRKKRTLFIGTVIFILAMSLYIYCFNYLSTYIDTSSTEMLKSLPYLAWVPAKESIEKKGVVKYDRGRSFDGINIYNSRHFAIAYLMDMSGNILHSWSKKMNQDDSWHHIELCKNGDLLCIVKDRMLIRLDWNSDIKWLKKGRFHHDINIVENGDIYALDRKDDLVFNFGIPTPILNDFFVILSPEGKIKRAISINEIIKREVPFDRLIKIYFAILNPKVLKELIVKKMKNDYVFSEGTPFDIFHTNTIEVVDEDIPGVCKKGNILTTFYSLDFIAVLDIEEKEVIWKWGSGKLSRQHHPTLLKNNNILIFDNGYSRGYSRIVELDPRTEEIVWEYKSVPPKKFYSQSRGANQRLPNGNTLITNSDSGHVFEITNDGEIVWEFYNPVIKLDSKEREPIYRMMRITTLENYSKPEELKKVFATK